MSRTTGFFQSCAAGLAGLALMLSPTARASSSILIWPIDPLLRHDQRATALWLENHGEQPSLLQLRVFAWRQADGEEHYHAQREVIGSPPMIRIAPGERQLVRLTQLKPAAAATEQAYRILIDEIPTPSAPDAEPGNAATVQFQLRYSVPLFVQGEGFSPPSDSPRQGDAAEANDGPLSWRPLSVNGRHYLEVRNQGAQHARLTRVSLEHQGATLEVASGLLGYVLAGSQMRWPLAEAVGTDARLRAERNGEPEEIPLWRP